MIFDGSSSGTCEDLNFFNTEEGRKKRELEIWSLQIPNVQRIPTSN